MEKDKQGKVNDVDVVFALAEKIDEVSPDLPVQVRTNTIGRAAVAAREIMQKISAGDTPENAGVISTAFAEVRGAPYNGAVVTFDKEGHVDMAVSAKAGTPEAESLAGPAIKANQEAALNGYRSLMVAQPIVSRNGP